MLPKSNMKWDSHLIDSRYFLILILGRYIICLVFTYVSEVCNIILKHCSKAVCMTLLVDQQCGFSLLLMAYASLLSCNFIIISRVPDSTVKQIHKQRYSHISVCWFLSNICIIFTLVLGNQDQYPKAIFWLMLISQLLSRASCLLALCCLFFP